MVERSESIALQSATSPEVRRELFSKRMLLSVMGMLLLLIGGWYLIKPLSTNFLPIRFVRVYGALEQVQKIHLQAALRKVVGDDYLGVDLAAIQVAAKSLPWVKSVQVTRIWPDTLMLGIVEQTPYVRWGMQGLLNERGEQFVPNNIEDFQALPVIFGPVGKESELFKDFQGLHRQLVDQGLGIQILHVTDRLSWSVRLKNGMDIALGRRDPTRVFKRFINTLPLLGPDQIQAMQRVDLRYPNGYAVDWKAGTELEWKPVVQQLFDETGLEVRSI
jgi:cell division protein FtsQ